jgi:drug/metabolite transporter (DMT)-like permease
VLRLGRDPAARGYLAIINGMVPLWTALIAVPVLKEPLGAKRIAGFALGVAGVALIVNLGPVALSWNTALAALVGIAGAAFWGLGRRADQAAPGARAPMGLAAGSIAFSALVMMPLLSQAPPASSWTPNATLALIALGAVCSGIAYLPFFTLIRDIGPSRTLTVGLAVPVLGVLWGWLLLGEAVTLTMLAGMALVLAALALVLRR